MTYDVCQKERRQITTVRGLLSIEPHYQKGSISPTTNRSSPGSTGNGQILHQAGHQGCLSQRQNQTRRRMENDIHNKMQHLRILCNTFRVNQPSGSFPEMDQQNATVIYRYMLHNIFGRCRNIFRRSGTTPKRCISNPSSHKRSRDEDQTYEV